MVQRSGLKNPQPTHIKRILFSSCIESRYTQMDMSGIQDLDQHGGQRPPVVTFEL
jgi:hypothetical protein